MPTHFNFNYNGDYYTFDVSTTQPMIKFTTKSKFKDTILVWIAMSPTGLNRPFIKKSGFAVNRQKFFEYVHSTSFLYLHP